MKKVIIFFFLLIASSNAQQKQWYIVGKMYRPVYGAQAVVVDTAIYIIGGFDNKLPGVGENEYSDSIRVYYPNSGRWGNAVHMIEPRYGLTAFNYNDSLVYFGGTKQQSPNSNALEVWNGKSAPYIYKSNSNFNRSFSCGTSAGDSLYFFGGNSQLTNFNYMVKYNLLTGTVTDSNNYSLTFPPQSNQIAAKDSSGRNIYLFGGINSYGTLSKSIFRFDILLNTFSNLNTELNRPLINGNAVNYGNNQIYIIGGRDETGPLSEAEVFNYKTLQISNGPSLVKARDGLAAVKYRNSIYVFGGQDKNNNPVDEIEKLDIVTDVNGSEPQPVKDFHLYNNFPNPFNPSTVIRYSVAKESFVTLKIYNLLGEEIVTLVNAEKPAGEYQVTFNSSVDGRQLQSGVYFYRLRVYSANDRTRNFVQTKKMILLK